MTIKRATKDDIDKLFHLATQFYDSSKFLKNFNTDCFRKTWTPLLESGVGVIFTLNDGDAMEGALGGIKHPDINNGEMTATEFFWFVSPNDRGEGLKLLKAFENWAFLAGCKKVIMCLLTDLMPPKVGKVYQRYDYKMAEIHYIKQL